MSNKAAADSTRYSGKWDTLPPTTVEVHELRRTFVWTDETGILFSCPKLGLPSPTLKEAQMGAAEFNEFIGGKKAYLVGYNDGSAPSSKEVRDYAAKALPELVHSIAIIATKPFTRMVANLFLGLKPPPYKAKVFSNDDEAIAWTLDIMKQNGDYRG